MVPVKDEGTANRVAAAQPTEGSVAGTGVGDGVAPAHWLVAVHAESRATSTLSHPLVTKD